MCFKVVPTNFLDDFVPKNFSRLHLSAEIEQNPLRSTKSQPISLIGLPLGFEAGILPPRADF